MKGKRREFRKLQWSVGIELCFRRRRGEGVRVRRSFEERIHISTIGSRKSSRKSIHIFNHERYHPGLTLTKKFTANDVPIILPGHVSSRARSPSSSSTHGWRTQRPRRSRKWLLPVGTAPWEPRSPDRRRQPGTWSEQ